jgi:hypothetical protein
LVAKLAVRKRNHLIEKIVLVVAGHEIDVATLHLRCKWLSPYLLGACNFIGVYFEPA